MRCSKPKLGDELNFIKKTLLKNGYPEDVITNPIKYKCLQFSTKPKFRPEKSLVYLKLPWIGNAIMQLLEQIKRSINCCFNLVELRVVLKSCFPTNLKDCATALQKTSLIYWFTHKCDICYIGCTNQCLGIRINQHIPLSIRAHTSDNTTMSSSYNSTSIIGWQLLANQTCGCVYRPTKFTILETSTNELRPSILEELLIKKYKPELCIQKQS